MADSSAGDPSSLIETWAVRKTEANKNSVEKRKVFIAKLCLLV
jgi:hypothetical protein